MNDKKKKIRYLNIKQEKLEKKLIAEIEKFALNRPKIPKDSQNPYQYLTTFNNLIGYFREKKRSYGPLFTWAQRHQAFTKISVPQHFENEYKDGGKKIFTKSKVKSFEEAITNKNYNSKFFEGVEFTNINNVFDLLNNNQIIQKNENDEILTIQTEENKLLNTKETLKSNAKTSNDTRNSFNQKKNELVINYDSNLDKYKGIITHYGRQLIGSENTIKHRKLFNITKLQDQNLYGETLDFNSNNLNKTNKSDNNNFTHAFNKSDNNFNDINRRSFQNHKNKSMNTNKMIHEFDKKEERLLRIKTEGEAGFYLNPFDLKNFSVNKILNNINERNQDKFQTQIEKMRENLKVNSGFLRNKSSESRVKLIEPEKKKDVQSPNNISSILKTATKFPLNKV